MQQDKVTCYLCGQRAFFGNNLEEHHVIYGQGNRKLSEKYGLKVYLHGDTCHRNGRGPHNNEETRRRLCEDAQRAFEKTHGTRDDFRRLFGKSWL